MAHTILVRLDVDDEYADIDPDITATDYLEGSKAYGWEVITERMYTESKVRAMLFAIDAAIMDDRAQMAIFHVAKKYGIIFGSE